MRATFIPRMVRSKSADQTHSVVPRVRLALTTLPSSGECSNYLSYLGNVEHYIRNCYCDEN